MLPAASQAPCPPRLETCLLPSNAHCLIYALHKLYAGILALMDAMLWVQLVKGIMRGAGVLCRKEKHNIWGQHGIYLPTDDFQIKLASNHDEVAAAITACYGGSTDASIQAAALKFSRRHVRSFVAGFCHSLYGEHAFAFWWLACTSSDSLPV